MIFKNEQFLENVELTIRANQPTQYSVNHENFIGCPLTVYVWHYV